MRMGTGFWVFAGLVVLIMALLGARDRRSQQPRDEVDRLRGRGCL